MCVCVCVCACACACVCGCVRVCVCVCVAHSLNDASNVSTKNDQHAVGRGGEVRRGVGVRGGGRENEGRAREDIITTIGIT